MIANYWMVAAMFYFSITVCLLVMALNRHHFDCIEKKKKGLPDWLQCCLVLLFIVAGIGVVCSLISIVVMSICMIFGAI